MLPVLLPNDELCMVGKLWSHIYPLSICTVLVKLVQFLPKLLCKFLEVKLLVCAGIQDSMCKGKPHYYIVTT